MTQHGSKFSTVATAVESLRTVGEPVGPKTPGESGEFVGFVEWVRLPGLFRWAEVCDVARGIQRDDEWCFAVRFVSVGPHAEPLYVVEAGARGKRRTH
jgi:hypothetical protein